MTLHESLNNAEEVLNENKLEEGFWQGAQQLTNNIKNNGVIGGVAKTVGSAIKKGIDKAASAEKAKDPASVQKLVDAVKDGPSMASACIAILNMYAGNKNIDWKDL